jgi:hypothetical protein
MTDLEQRVRGWRRETEATLAFSAEELDELEDHLRLSLEAKQERGIALDQAWDESITDLGASSLLALEFAKEMLMPALGRLLYSWWKPAMLCLLFTVVAVSWSDQGWGRIVFWSALGLGTILSVLFLPDRAGKNAILSGVGLALCLVPPLYDLCYNAALEKIIGPGWPSMGATFGAGPIVLSIAGLLIIGAWRWNRRPGAEERTSSAVTAWLILLLAVVPVFCEVMGDLSLRELYELPTVAQLILTGDARTHYQLFKFVEVLANGMIFLTNWVPPLIAALALFFSMPLVRFCRAPSWPEAFPARRDIPWIMLLLTSGFFLVWGLVISTAFRHQIGDMKENYPDAFLHGDGGGLWWSVIIIAGCFALGAANLAESLRRAPGVRPYYAGLIVVFEILTVIGVALDIATSAADVAWALAGLVMLALAARQGKWIAAKRLAGCEETSVSKSDGGELVKRGLQFGLIIAGTGSAFFALAIVMAYASVVYIKALIEWGNSIKDPVANVFHPGAYFTAQALEFWVVCGSVYLAACLAVGLGLTMAWTALEFIRFNTYRLFRLRRLRVQPVVAVNS